MSSTPNPSRRPARHPRPISRGAPARSGPSSRTRWRRPWSSRSRASSSTSRYGRFQRKSARFLADDRVLKAQPGDTVQIEETRPLSARKRWRVTAIVTKGRAAGLRHGRGSGQRGEEPAEERAREEAREGRVRAGEEDVVIQMGTILEVADNSGARRLAASRCRAARPAISAGSATSSPAR